MSVCAYIYCSMGHGAIWSLSAHTDTNTHCRVNPVDPAHASGLSRQSFKKPVHTHRQTHIYNPPHTHIHSHPTLKPNACTCSFIPTFTTCRQLTDHGEQLKSYSQSERVYLLHMHTHTHGHTPSRGNHVKRYMLSFMLSFMLFNCNWYCMRLWFCP